MNIRFSILLFLVVWLGSSTVNAVQSSSESCGNVRILLEKERCGTRSGTTTAVEAFVNDDILILDISGYFGFVAVEVFGTKGGLQCQAYIAGSEQVVINLSSLPAGTYMLNVTLDYTYRGSFER